MMRIKHWFFFKSLSIRRNHTECLGSTALCIVKLHSENNGFRKEKLSENLGVQCRGDINLFYTEWSIRLGRFKIDILMCEVVGKYFEYKFHS